MCYFSCLLISLYFKLQNTLVFSKASILFVVFYICFYLYFYFFIFGKKKKNSLLVYIYIFFSSGLPMTDLVNILCVSENIIPYLVFPPAPWPVTLEPARQPARSPLGPTPCARVTAGGFGGCLFSSRPLP